MMFLTWTSQKDAADSLAAVNAVYGCPYVAENGYRMDQWDRLIESGDQLHWGFFKPDSKLGKEMSDLRDALVPGYSEREEKPPEFYPEETSI